ncbi:MAG: glycosyltransferase [Clostridiaceae bacterium]
MKIGILESEHQLSSKIMQGYYEAFNDCEVKVEWVSKNDIEQLYFDVIKPFDYIIAYNSEGFIKYEEKFILALKGIKLISVYFDYPYNNLNGEIKQEMKANYDYYYNFIWDNSFVKLMISEGIRNCFHIMLSLDKNVFFPEKLESNMNLSFVGIINTNDTTDMTTITEVNNFIDEIINAKVNDLSLRTLDLCFKLINEGKYPYVKNILISNEELFWKIIYFSIHVKGNTVIRKKYLTNLNQVIDVFGGAGWESNKINFHQGILYNKDLSAIYKKTKININISAPQLETSVNNRVFDVLGSKSFLLSDYKEDMKTIFPDIWRNITYKNSCELNKKIEYYLEHDIERNELVEFAYDTIVKNHTYVNRVKYILSIIK